jgi:predicted DNA binding protein
MTVILEFTLPAESFSFGRATGGDPDVLVEIERIVPAGDDRIPFLWATGEEFDRFERHLRDSEIVERVERSTRIGDSALYSVEWHEGKEPFLNGVVDTGGTIVEGSGDDAWSFTVRFADPSDLERFHQFYHAHDYPLEIERIHSHDETAEIEFGAGLSPAQREALRLAVEHGYFSIPRETTLEEIAEDLGISRQAVSERVRRGTESVLHHSITGIDPGREEAEETAAE